MENFLAQAFRELKADRFRTLLSLLGVAVGIFSIMAVLTLVGSIRETIEEGFENFGTDIVFVERDPLEPDLNEDGVFRWWEYISRPPVTYDEFRFLSRHSEVFERISFAAYGADCVGVDGTWDMLVQAPLASGRGFSKREISQGTCVALIGQDILEKNPRATTIRVGGCNYQVIGVFERAGTNMVSTVDIDGAVIVPYAAMRGVAGRCSIAFSGADEEAVRMLMREYRRLRPAQKDNFALNRLSFILDEMSEVFNLVARIGWIIGVFSLLVGGFGIANIMYVSVAERKPQIGIRRSLGARRRTIVLQFLGEAVVLSVLGGLAGVSAVAVIVAIVSAFVPAGTFHLVLSAGTIFVSTVVSIAIGLLSGIFPALSASRLNPVDAICGR